MKSVSRRFSSAARFASKPALIVFSLLLLALAPRAVFADYILVFGWSHRF